MDASESKHNIRVDSAHDLKELLVLASQPDPDVRQVIRVVRNNRQVASVILREANAVRNALLRRIEDVDHAVVYLGSARVARAVERILNRHSDLRRLDGQRVASRSQSS